MTVISDELALEIIRRAFLPLNCGAEVYDYGEKIRFRLVNNLGEAVLNVTGVERAEFSESDRLGALLSRVREDITGYKDLSLDPWEMPAIRLI